MTQILNAPTIMIALGVLQPATAFEVVGFLKKMLPDAGVLPDSAAVLGFLKEREATGHIIRVERREGGASVYSLTLAGHRYLTAFTCCATPIGLDSDCRMGGRQGWSALRRLQTLAHS